jgi:hypothetical protein
MLPERVRVLFVLQVAWHSCIASGGDPHVLSNGFVDFTLGGLHAALIVRVQNQVQPPLLVTTVVGRNLQCELVRGVNTREGWHWSHA